MTADGRTRAAGVVGWPVEHSRSPRLHGFWIERYGVNGAYLPLPVRPEDFSLVLPALGKAGFAGVNITIPHKEAALALCDSVDATARRIGAVNTIRFTDGGIEGTNTDAFGFLASIGRLGPPAGTAGPAVLLGAGGAARAVLAALADAGFAPIRVVNRTVETAMRMIDSLGVAAEPVAWEHRERALGGAALLVNATSLGMTGQPPLDLSLDALPRGALVTDLVYVPLETRLLAAARARGNPVVDGLDMLLHQARKGFHLWFGVDPAVDGALRDFVVAGLPGGVSGTDDS